MHDIKCNLFSGGRPKALTLSFDDGRDHDRRLVAALNRYGLRAAFHLNNGFFGREGYIGADEVASLYAGHEVACHTVNHPLLPITPLDQVVSEIAQNRRDLEALVDYPVRGFSYPCGGHNHDQRLAALLPALGIARTSAPNSNARLTARHKPRALKLPVGFNASSLIYVCGQPICAPRRGAGKRGVHPSPRVRRAAAACTGNTSA